MKDKESSVKVFESEATEEIFSAWCSVCVCVRELLLEAPKKTLFDFPFHHHRAGAACLLAFNVKPVGICLRVHTEISGQVFF